MSVEVSFVVLGICDANMLMMAVNSLLNIHTSLTTIIAHIEPTNVLEKLMHIFMIITKLERIENHRQETKWHINISMRDKIASMNKSNHAQYAGNYVQES